MSAFVSPQKHLIHYVLSVLKEGTDPSTHIEQISNAFAADGDNAINVKYTYSTGESIDRYLSMY